MVPESRWQRRQLDLAGVTQSTWGQWNHVGCKTTSASRSLASALNSPQGFFGLYFSHLQNVDTASKILLTWLTCKSNETALGIRTLNKALMRVKLKQNIRLQSRGDQIFPSSSFFFFKTDAKGATQGLRCPVQGDLMSC